MEWIVMLNKILDLKPVQYLLLLSVVVLTVLSGYSMARQKVLGLQLDAANGNLATYAAHIEAQNYAVIKAGAEYEEQKKKALTAQQEAEKLRQRVYDMGKIVIAPNTCTEMVLQAVTEVRK
jgi:hypothetical protein